MLKELKLFHLIQKMKYQV